MNFKLTFIFLALVKIGFSQDTLSCKKDLTWDKAGKFYYKTLDVSKAKYTGPAKCYPQKGVENRGYLKNGAWEGKVFGYKENQLLGYATFKEGFYNGETVRYDENKHVKDSLVYKMGDVLYSKVYKRNKYTILTESIEKIIGKDTILVKTLSYEEDIPTFLGIERYSNKKKNGAFETYWITLDAKKNLEYIASSYKVFKEGILQSERNFDNGVLYEEKQYLNGKITKQITYFGDINKIETEIPYVKGKIHGDVKTYDINGKLLSVEKYVNGKSMELIEY